MAYIIRDLQGNPVKQNGKEVFGMDFTEVVKAVDLKKRILTLTATDETRDRDGDILTLKGWILDNFMKNPVFLWAHDYRSVPIGAVIKLIRRRNPARMDAIIRFPSEGLYPFADMVLKLYAEKIINACSVGFIPYEWEPIEEKETDDEMIRRSGRRYLKQELLEISGCPVPANPNAVQEAVESLGYENFDLQKAIVPSDSETKLKILREIKQMAEKIDLEEETRGIYQVPEDINDEKMEEESSDEKQRENVEICGKRDLPIDPRPTWNGTLARRRIAKWASSDGSGDKDKIDWNKYKQAFVVRDKSKIDNFGSYSLPFADVIDGKLKATWGGVRAAMGAVLGARGGINISESVRKRAYNFLAAYYKKFDKPVPAFHLFDDALRDLLEIPIEEELEEIKNLLSDLMELLTEMRKELRELKAEKEATGESNDDSQSVARDIYDIILELQSEQKEEKEEEREELTDLVKQLKEIVEEVKRWNSM